MATEDLVGGGAAQAGAPEAAGAAGAAGAAAEESDSQAWLSGATPDEVAYAQRWGHETPLGVLRALRGMERLKGAPAAEIARIPHEEDQEGWSALYNRLGRPESAEGYELEIQAGAADLRPFLLPAAHQAGLTQKQVATLMPAVEGMFQQLYEQQQGQLEQRRDAESAELRREWGGAFEQNVQLADRGAEVLGLEQQDLDAMAAAIGPRKVMHLLHRVGSGIQEARAVQGDSASGRFALTPAAAQAEIERMHGDASWREAIDGGPTHPGFKAAKRREIELYQAAFPNS